MHVNRQEKRTRFNNPPDARCKVNWNIGSTTKWVATPRVAKNDSTRTTDAGVATTRNECRRRARIIVPGTILIVPVRILAVNASHLRSIRTRTLSPVTCMAKIANIPTTSARAIQKNVKTMNKSSYYAKKRGNDANYGNNRRYSSGDNPPTSECDTLVPSDGEVENKSSYDEKSNSNYHIYYTPKKRRLVEKNDGGHKSPTQKKRKTLVEPDSGIKKKRISPKKHRIISKKDGNLLNIYDDITSDDEKSCLSITNENALSFVNSDKDDAFGFPN